MRDYNGVPVQEVQLSADVDVNDADAVNAALGRAMERKDLQEQGLLRKVKKAAAGASSPGIPFSRSPGTRRPMVFGEESTASCTMITYWGVAVSYLAPSVRQSSTKNVLGFSVTSETDVGGLQAPPTKGRWLSRSRRAT